MRVNGPGNRRLLSVRNPSFVCDQQTLRPIQGARTEILTGECMLGLGLDDIKLACDDTCCQFCGREDEPPSNASRSSEGK